LLNGAAFGYISYDCVRYFETKVDAFPQPDVLGLPESAFIFSTSFVVIDHSLPAGTIKIVSLCEYSSDPATLDVNYNHAIREIATIEHMLKTADPHVFHNLPNTVHGFVLSFKLFA